MIGIFCLALNIYHEARGEPLDGQVAVAAVTLNRTLDPAFPDDICGVVFDPHQFSWTTNPPPVLEPEAFDLALQLALDAEPDPDFGLFYHSITVEPYWAVHFTQLGRMGNHVFYTSH